MKKEVQSSEQPQHVYEERLRRLKIKAIDCHGANIYKGCLFVAIAITFHGCAVFFH